MKWRAAIWTVSVFAAGVAAGKWLWTDAAGTAGQPVRAAGQLSVSGVQRSGEPATRLGKMTTAADWMRAIAKEPGGAGAVEFLAHIQTLDAAGLQALAEDIFRLPDDADVSGEAVTQLLSRWAALDPRHMLAAALKWQHTGPDGGDDMEFPYALIKALENAAPDTLVRALGAVHDSKLMQPVWRALWNHAKREELMRHFIASPHREALSFLMGQFEADFASAKPAEAEAVLRMLVKYQPSKVSGYSDAIIAWASKDQAAALAFAQSLTDPNQRARGGVDTSAPRTFTITIDGGSLTNLEAWRRVHFGTPSNTGSAADTASPQGDGLPNLLKFAMGMDPNVRGVSPVGIALNGGLLEFTYPRSSKAVAEATFIVEWSETLGTASWSSVGVSQQVLSTTGQIQQIKASLPRGTAEHRYVRCA